MALFKKAKFSELAAKKVEIPNGLWSKCENCKEMIYTKQLEENLRVCPKCQHHFRMNANERIKLLVDEGTWQEDKARVIPTDPLNFPEYKEK
ncbi:MAG: acetyl-CoA carboxylase carboxyl transferase subunit beta, partial [Candidatus Firestonebacteria bacterium]